LIARSFAERVQSSPLRHATRADGSLIEDEEEAAAAAWADSLTMGFRMCDQGAVQEVGSGACGAVVCVVARSGIYVASVGLSRAVIGTEADGEILCDEASSPHRLTSESELERLADAGPTGASPPQLPSKAPTRFFGGAALKQADARLVGLPDVIRHQHGSGRRFVILGTPAIWEHGPRLPLQWAVEAYRAGRSPADELVARSQGADAVALVLVLPAGLGEGSRLPPHHELVAPAM